MSDNIRIFGGAASLFKKPNSQNWHVRFSVAGHGAHRESTGEKDVKKAERAAKKIYINCTSRGERGLSLNGYAFEQVAKEFLQNYQRKVTRGEKTNKDLTNLTGVVTRYFIPYFGQDTIDEIDDPQIEEYKDWRKDYWISGPGREIHFITYKRGRHTLKRPARHEVPSLSRQYQELSFLRQFFKFAARKRYIDKRDLPEIISEPVKNNEGAGLTEAEFNTLQRKSYESMLSTQHPRVMRSRELLHCFIIIASQTGMRPTELYQMRWGDIKDFHPTEDMNVDYVNDEGKRVRRHLIEDRERILSTDITIDTRGKGKRRTFVPSVKIAESLDDLHKMWVRIFEQPPGSEDPLFFNANGEPIKSFRKSFSNLLKSADLLHDRQQRMRSTICLRHYYITRQIAEGVPYQVVALNVGTSVKMIEKTYSHVVPLMFAEQLRRP